jgi:LysR family transcriptional regulator, hydrogen peroxide-inducible genes activator
MMVAAMELQQVRYFLALCEEGSFTRAAMRCGVSQPSLSNGIKRLEQEFGGLLFHRSLPKCRLTELGRAVRPCLLELERCVLAACRNAASFSANGAILT